VCQPGRRCARSRKVTARGRFTRRDGVAPRIVFSACSGARNVIARTSWLHGGLSHSLWVLWHARGPLPWDACRHEAASPTIDDTLASCLQVTKNSRQMSSVAVTRRGKIECPKAFVFRAQIADAPRSGALEFKGSSPHAASTREQPSVDQERTTEYVGDQGGNQLRARI
jgi:hypothetical protein